VLNSTTNIILTRMEKGETFDEAVRYCQSVGVAETDPSADIDGWDAAIKVAALVTVLMRVRFSPQQVRPTGIREITAGMVAQAKSKGQRYKVVCSAAKEGSPVRASVGPQLVSISDPLYGMEDSTTGITFRTDVLGDYSIIESEREGMGAGPEPTAYGLFADFVRAVTTR
jgi:homoserine dehydrogenase